jgi:hypothetical protein
VAPGDTREDVYEIGLRIDAVQLAGLDQRGEDGPVLTATIRPGEERILAIEGNRQNGALDGIAIDPDGEGDDQLRLRAALYCDVSTPGRKAFSDGELAASPTKRNLQGLE